MSDEVAQPEAPDLRPRKPDSSVGVVASIALFVCAAAAGMGLVALVTGEPLVPVLFPGAAQLVGVVPLLIYAHKKKKRVLAKVTWIFAGVVFLLNATCFGILAFGGFSIH